MIIGNRVWKVKIIIILKRFRQDKNDFNGFKEAYFRFILKTDSVNIIKKSEKEIDNLKLKKWDYSLCLYKEC